MSDLSEDSFSHSNELRISFSPAETQPLLDTPEYWAINDVEVLKKVM
jgi:hypothetical protein